MTGERRFLVGLDDTDFGESIGTGALSRELNLFLVRRLGLQSHGITRHQFLVHPDIPYTSHNSSACIELSGSSTVDAIATEARQFIEYLFHPGADPGLCVATPDQLSPACLSFGIRAQNEVLKKQEAIDTAREHRVLLLELGGTGQGIIGAFCGCALRSSANDGRFISMRGIREIDGEMTVAELTARTGIDRVVDESGNPLAPDCLVDTTGGARPELILGRIVQPVVTRDDGTYRVPKRQKGEDK